MSIRFTDSIVSRNLQHTHRTQTVSRAAITTHAMQPSVQSLNMAWVDHCLCSMSKDVTPLCNGDAKGWILRGGCPESKLQMDQERKEGGF